MQMGNVIPILALAISLLTYVVAVTAVIIQMRTNLGNLAEKNEKQEQREDKAARDTAEMFVLLKSFIAEQTVINKTMTMALEGTIRKLEEMDKRTVESATVVSLLSEIMSRKSVEVKGLSIEPTGR
jgi:uncharacterized protein (UPF0147 family)